MVTVVLFAISYGIGAGEPVTAENDRFPEPSVVNTSPLEPPVIVILLIEPKLLSPDTTRFPDETVLLDASKVMLPADRPFFTLKYLNATVPYSLLCVVRVTKNPHTMLFIVCNIKY